MQIMTETDCVGQVEITCDNPNGWYFSAYGGHDGNNVSTLTIEITNKDITIVPEFTVKFAVPQYDMQHFWWPESCWKGQILSMGKIKCRTNLVEWMPIFAIFNELEENRLTVACSEDIYPLQTTTGIREIDASSAWEITYFRNDKPSLKKYQTCIRFDRRQIPFYMAVKEGSDWMSLVQNAPRMTSPSHTYKPVYSTWYAFHRELTASLVEAEFARAAELGMRTAILDSGWQQDDASIAGIFNGDWVPAKTRFPNMRAHVDRVHKLGLKYMLWFGPPFIGDRAEVRTQFKDKLMARCEVFKCGILDPRFPDVREYLISCYERAVRDWDFDGLKLDFLYWFQASSCTADDVPGRDYSTIADAAIALMDETKRRLTAIKNDVRIEIHMCYMGPTINRFGNQQHASDCMGSAAADRVAIGTLRLTSGEMSVHADMLRWNNGESCESVANLIMSSLFGTIQYSVNLAELSPEHKDVLTHWIRFANEHEDALQHGEIRPHHPDMEFPVIEGECENERIVGIYKPKQIVDIGPANKRIIILNATMQDKLYIRISESHLSISAFNYIGKAVSTSTLLTGINEISVPVSGYLIVTDCL